MQQCLRRIRQHCLIYGPDLLHLLLPGHISNQKDIFGTTRNPHEHLVDICDSLQWPQKSEYLELAFGQTARAERDQGVRRHLGKVQKLR